MPIHIAEPDLDARIDRLVQAQPMKVSRTALATAIVTEACERFEATGDPDAWRLIVPSTPDATTSKVA